jgi:malate synthase
LINPSYLEPIFSEESAKVASIPGIDANHVKIASEYMLSQVKGKWPSDFLTSDLMIHLEGVGVSGGARKSAL